MFKNYFFKCRRADRHRARGQSQWQHLDGGDQHARSGELYQFGSPRDHRHEAEQGVDDAERFARHSLER